MFNLRCLNSGVVPKYLRVVPRLKTVRCQRAAEKTSRTFLAEALRQSLKNLEKIRRELTTVKNSLVERLSVEHMGIVCSLASSRASRQGQLAKERQVRKFNQLIWEKRGLVSEGNESLRTTVSPPLEVTEMTPLSEDSGSPGDDQQQQRPLVSHSEVIDKWVINHSDKVLNDAELKVLRKGLNYAVTPRHIDMPSFIAPVEHALFWAKLDKVDADQVRRRVDNILVSTKNPKQNLSSAEHEALKNLQQDSSIMVLAADKGSAVVLLNTTDYHSKVNDLLSTGPYRQIVKDPTDKITRSVKQLLGSCKNQLGQRLYDKLRPKASKPPRLYGLPKIHKPNIPLRPIVSCTDSPTYELSSHLAQILAPMVGSSSPTFVKDSAHFTEMTQSLAVRSDELMVSFDVEALFTNVPVDEALIIIQARLENDAELAARTPLSVDQIIRALELCLRSTYFIYEGKYFEQVDGAAMGSPVSPVVANLYMEHFEQEALAACPDPPRVWKRYVDDTFVLCRLGKVDALLEFLNSRNRYIRFSYEVEKENTLPFLDCLVNKDPNGSLGTTVYRKPTHTDHYLHFDSHNPLSTKAAVVGCLARRAQRVCTSSEAVVRENKHLVETFRANSYPTKFVKNQIRRAQRPTEPPTDKQELKAWARLPYVKGVSEAISRVLRQQGIGATFYPPDTIRGRLMHPKDKLPLSLSSNVVYKVDCQEDCGLSYVGKTIRNMGERMKEHAASIRLQQPDKSSLAKHCEESGHVPRTDNPTVLARAPNDAELLTKEAIFLESLPNLINAQEGHQFSNLRLYSRSLKNFRPRVAK